MFPLIKISLEPKTKVQEIILWAVLFLEIAVIGFVIVVAIKVVTNG